MFASFQVGLYALHKASVSLKQTSKFCPFCQSNVLATGTKPNHLLHFIISFFTCTLWVPVWILIAIGKIGGYRCTRCGNNV